eukprot:5740202-Pyramimonas_sp.AAC.1
MRDCPAEWRCLARAQGRLRVRARRLALEWAGIQVRPVLKYLGMWSRPGAVDHCRRSLVA